LADMTPFLVLHTGFKPAAALVILSYRRRRE
jgi:hypothetical protein